MIFVSIARFPPQSPNTAIEPTVPNVTEPAPDAESIETESLPDTTSVVEQSGGDDTSGVGPEPSTTTSSRRASQASMAPSSNDTPVPYTVDVPSSQPQTRYVAPSSQEPVLVPIIPKVLSDGNTYYWSSGGEVYHLIPDCPHLKNAANISSGELGEAQRNGRKRLCLDCEKKYNSGQKEDAN